MLGLSLRLSEDTINLVKRRGGASQLWGSPTLPPLGYLVGCAPKGFVVVRGLTPQYLMSVSKIFDQGGFDGVRVWVTGTAAYVVPVLHTENRTEAQLYATLWGESSIWDCTQGCEHQVTSPTE